MISGSLTFLPFAPLLQFRYKRRVYTQSLLDDKQFAKLHTKVRRTALPVRWLAVGGLASWREHGLDPKPYASVAGLSFSCHTHPKSYTVGGVKPVGWEES